MGPFGTGDWGLGLGLDNFFVSFHVSNPGLKTNFRSTGIPWEFVQDGVNSFYSASLLYAEKTDLVFTETLPPPPGLVTSVCVSFKYRKYSLGKIDLNID